MGSSLTATADPTYVKSPRPAGSAVHAEDVPLTSSGTAGFAAIRRLKYAFGLRPILRGINREISTCPYWLRGPDDCLFDPEWSLSRPQRSIQTVRDARHHPAVPARGCRRPRPRVGPCAGVSRRHAPVRNDDSSRCQSRPAPPGPLKRRLAFYWQRDAETRSRGARSQCSRLAPRDGVCGFLASPASACQVALHAAAEWF